MGSIFSRVAVRFNPETPEWFPSESLALYLAESYRQRSPDTTDDEIYQYFSKKVKQVAYTAPVNIKKNSYFFNWFHRIYVHLNTKRHPLPFRIKGVIRSTPHIRPGIRIKSGYALPPNAFHVSLELYSLTKYDFQLKFKIPDFSAASSLSKEHPVPNSSYQLSDTRLKMLGQHYHTTQADYTYTWHNFTRSSKLAISHVSKLFFDKYNTLFFYDPLSYNKIAFSYMRKVPGGVQNIETALLSLPGSYVPLPYMKLVFQNSFSLPKFIKAYTEVGALMAPKSVPIKERFHVGGPPYARGIPSFNFSRKSSGVPSGSDLYAIGGIDTSIHLIQNLDFHFFVNAGVSALTKSGFFLDYTPGFSGFASYGGGYVYHGKRTDYELNFNIPFITSSGLNFDKFQWAFIVK